MMELVLAMAAEGDPESIKTLAFLRDIGFKDLQRLAEPAVERELKIWEILDMCVLACKERKEEYRKRCN